MTAFQDHANKAIARQYADDNPTVNTLTVTSGAAQQDASGQPSTVYVPIAGGSAGTVKVDIGPDNTVAVPIIPARDATLSQTAMFRLPAGWYFKVTAVTATVAAGTRQVVGS